MEMEKRLDELLPMVLLLSVARPRPLRCRRNAQRRLCRPPSPPQVQRQERAPPPARPPSTAERFIDFSDVSWIDYPGVALFLIPFALLLADLFARYLLSQPLMGAYELTSFSGGVAALFGAAVRCA
jgi:hypothetical protein